MFGRRAILTLISHRWVVMPRSELASGERKHVIDSHTAASLVSGWGEDTMNWAEMFRLFGDLTGSTMRPVTTAEVEEHVMPALRAAFEHGQLVALRHGSKDAKKKPEEVFGRQALPEPPPLPDQPRVLRAVSEKTFIEAQVVNTKGEPLAGHRYKLQLPSGATEKGALGADGVVRATNIDPGTGRLTILPNDGKVTDAGKLPSPDISPGDRGEFTVKVLTASGQAVPRLDIAFVSDGTTTVVATDSDGLAVFEGPVDPPPTAQVANADQLRERIEQLAGDGRGA
jgi:hypothetical protein